MISISYIIYHISYIIYYALSTYLNILKNIYIFQYMDEMNCIYTKSKNNKVHISN